MQMHINKRIHELKKIAIIIFFNLIFDITQKKVAQWLKEREISHIFTLFLNPFLFVC